MAPVNDHIMIDIETLSTASNAAIVSIGACTFSLDDDAVAAGYGAKTFLVGIHPDFYDFGTLTPPISGTGNSFHVDPKTVAWWKKQSKEARDSLKINQVQTLPLALDLMQTWFDDVGFMPSHNPFYKGAKRIWANPAAFDLVILRNGARHAYGSTDDVPWHYRQETCCRTHSWLFPELAREAGRKHHGELEKHRADHDAIRQARVVQFIEASRNDGR